MFPSGVPISKRLFDLISSLLVVIILSPVYLILSLLVLLNLGSPVFFVQERPGLRGKPIRVIKFRSMRSPRPGEEGVEFDSRRLTRFGRFLRASSLDELPELFCILAGSMSVVGPRPLLTSYL